MASTKDVPLRKMDRDKVTVLQLKEVLRQLGLSQKGNKPDLLRRLYEHNPIGTWKQWVEEIPADEMADEETTTQLRRNVMDPKRKKRSDDGRLEVHQDNSRT